MLRPAKHLRLIGPEILALAQIIKPFSVPGGMNPVIPFNFCAKLYEAGRRLFREEVDYADIPLSQGEAFLINQQVQLEDFETANMLLLQTWDILREYESQVPEAIESGLQGLDLGESLETKNPSSVFSESDNDSPGSPDDEGTPVS
jgi:hypothetical protein